MRIASFLALLAFLVMAGALAGAGEIKDPALRKAWEAIKEKRLFEAREVLSGYEPAPKTQGQYHYLWAKAESSQLRAIEHLRWAYLYCPGGEMKELALLERAEAYEDLGYYGEARSGYLVFFEAYPASVHAARASLGVARCLAEMGRYEEALKYFEKAGDSAEASFGRANALQSLGWSGRAREAYDEALSRFKGYMEGSEETLYLYGENLRTADRYEEAKKYLKEVKGAKYRSRARIALGRIALKEGAPEEAVKQFTAASRSSSRTVARTALLGLAEAQIRTGKRDQARRSLEQIRLDYPYGGEYDRALLMLSGIYGEEGRYGDAVALLKELIFRATPVKEALDRFEAMMLKVKDRDEFVKLWKSAGSWLLDASREDALMEIARGLRAEGEPFIEISRWLSEHGSRKARLSGTSALADFYAEMGDEGLAGQYLATLKKLGGDADEVLRAEAAIAYAGGDRRAAAEKLMSIEDFNKDDFGLLAHCLRWAPEADKAIALFEGSLGEDSGADAYVTLADALYGRGRTAEALRYYRLALQKEPENEWALYRAAGLSGEAAAEGLLGRLRRGGSAFSRFADGRLKEVDLARKLSGAM